MRKTYKLLLALFLTCWVGVAWAQNRSVSGKVTDSGDGSPLPGVSVAIKGTTTGATTGADGKYTLASVPDNATLVFSFIGFTTEEVAIGNRTTVDVRMISDIKSLQEVVVTAVGIERDKKALGYGVATASGDQLAQRSEPDALRSLTGKVAGVNIISGGGSPGQGTRITIRGNNSFTGNNQPLFVVDGIPFDNSVNSTSDFSTATTTSNRAFDLDPNNIESMTVLKGAAAAALYGNRGANGVIVITTKSGGKGKKKGLEVTYNTSYSIEKLASIPDYQDVYGQGSNQNYNGGFIGNWGAPFPGEVDRLNQQIGFDYYTRIDSVPHPLTSLPFTRGRYSSVFPDLVGKKVPYAPHDIVGGFFETGHVLENGISISSTSDKTTLTAGFGRMVNEGMVPNSRSARTTLNFGGNSKLANGLTLSGNVNYVNTTQQNPQSGASFFEDYGGGTQGSIYARIFYLPRNFNLNEYPFENPLDGTNVFYRALDNPRWTAKYNLYNSNVNRVYGVTNLSYDVTPWLNLLVKGGINTYSEQRTNIIRKGGFAVPLGRISNTDLTNTEIDLNYIASVNKDFSEKINFRALVGMNMNQRQYREAGTAGTDITDPSISNVNNTATQTSYQYKRLRRLYGVFTDISVGYNNYLFLGFTARNDWSSTLPKSNRSYFFPSVNSSFAFTDAFGIQSRILSYGKVRASWARVGKDADPYQVSTVYFIGSPSYTRFDGTQFPFASQADRLNNANLKPEFTTETEFGTDLQFFENRIGLDLTYFNRLSTDLIVTTRLPASTGFTNQVINAGKIQNRGWEVGLNVKPIKTNSGFLWETYFAFTRIRSLVKDAGPSGEFLIGGPNSALGTMMRAGQQYGMIFGSKYARDDKGNILIYPGADTDNSGKGIPAPQSDIIGNPNANFTLGITNTFSFKGFTLSALVDWRQGGQMYSVTAASLLLRGQLAGSAVNREAVKVIPGVYGDPQTFKPILDDQGNTIKNTTGITSFDYFFTNGFGAYGADETNVYDVTTIRLREVTLGYSFPKALVEKTKVLGSLRIQLSGRNLWWHSPNFLKGLNFDPEVLSNFPDLNIQGFDLGAAPSTRRYGVNLIATF